MDNATTIDGYLHSLGPEQRAEFERIRAIVKHIVPETQETISYGMPTFKYKGTYLLYFGAFKNHMSIFPGPGPIAKHQDQLKDFKTAKGTIQFTKEKPLPESLIEAMVQERLTGILEK